MPDAFLQGDAALRLHCHTLLLKAWYKACAASMPCNPRPVSVGISLSCVQAIWLRRPQCQLTTPAMDFLDLAGVLHCALSGATRAGVQGLPHRQRPCEHAVLGMVLAWNTASTGRAQLQELPNEASNSEAAQLRTLLRPATRYSSLGGPLSVHMFVVVKKVFLAFQGLVRAAETDADDCPAIQRAVGCSQTLSMSTRLLS